MLKLFPRPAGIAAVPLANSDEVAIGDPVSTMTFLFQSSGGKPALTRVNGAISSLDVRGRVAPAAPDRAT